MGSASGSEPDPGALGRAIRHHVETVGPIGFDEYVAHALYTPGLGFYQRGGGAGRRRDFLTSPEVGPLFGAVVARALDGWWDELGRPDRYLVVEAGAGPGTLARTVLAASPRCGDALELVLVESSPVQWTSHPPGVTSRTDLPTPDEVAGAAVVVLANELLDNLPFGLAERTGSGWAEVRVGPDPSAATGLVEELQELDDVRVTWCDGRAPRAAPGARIPVQSHAAAWVADATALVEAAEGGRVVIADYASTSADLAARPMHEWVRTYASHGRGGPPLDRPGSCDITCEVAVDQLALVRPPALDTDQATFLRRHGIEDLVAEGRDRWAASGWAGGLPALAGRSRATEAEALTDATGLGAFRVLEWTGAPKPRSVSRSDGSRSKLA